MAAASTSGRRRTAAIVAVLVLLTTSLPADVQPPVKVREYQVKAAFLCNFASFVEWPRRASGGGPSEIVIGILGPDPFRETIDRLVESRSTSGKRTRVRRFSRVEDLEPCQILFVSNELAPSLQDVLHRLRGESVLTVGESEDFARQGGIINFVMENSRVQFEINRAAARSADLRISSKLLNLARSVR